MTKDSGCARKPVVEYQSYLNVCQCRKEHILDRMVDREQDDEDERESCVECARLDEDSGDTCVRTALIDA